MPTLESRESRVIADIDETVAAAHVNEEAISGGTVSLLSDDDNFNINHDTRVPCHYRL
jgi:hypothetical protein